ncbi:MAG: hypothetical protein IJK26_09835 [Clostridia bacterium]|nr:hypothetical protein [Clostridia bacterium]
MKEIKVRFKNGSVRTVKIPMPKSLNNLEECDYIDNWLVQNFTGVDGWFI